MLGNRISSRSRMASSALRVMAAAVHGTPFTSSTERTNWDRSGFPGSGDGPPPGDVGGPGPDRDAVGTGLGDSLGDAEGDDPIGDAGFDGFVDGVGDTTGGVLGGPVVGPV